MTINIENQVKHAADRVARDLHAVAGGYMFRDEMNDFYFAPAEDASPENEPVYITEYIAENALDMEYTIAAPDFIFRGFRVYFTVGGPTVYAYSKPAGFVSVCASWGENEYTVDLDEKTAAAVYDAVSELYNENLSGR